MQPLSFLRQIANFSPGRDMIFQNFGQGVSNLSTVAELRTFDGTFYSPWLTTFTNFLQI